MMPAQVAAAEPNFVRFRFAYKLHKAEGGNFRGGWKAKHAVNMRKKEKLEKAWDAFWAPNAPPTFALPLIVRFTRISPGTLDDDNLSAAFKPFRDALAGKLGFDDRSLLCHWRYYQEKGRPALRPMKGKPATSRSPAVPARPASPAQWEIMVEVEEARCELCALPLTGRSTVDRSETGFRCPRATDWLACCGRRGVVR